MANASPSSAPDLPDADLPDSIPPDLPFQDTFSQEMPLSSSAHDRRVPKVSIWETIVVLLGAGLLVTAGLGILAMKFLANAAVPQRAEAIAKNIMSYRLPESSQALLGLNISGAKVALVASEGKEPDIQLLVARIPVDQTLSQRRIDQILNSLALGASEKEFKVSASRIENKRLCQKTIPVTIKQGRLKQGETPAKFVVTYRASATLSGSRYVVNLLTSGKNAEQNAIEVFSSLQCRE